MADLSILIPSRSEMFLAQTIQDILANIEGETEIIAVLDGAWAHPPIQDHPRVQLIYHSQPIGQRAATNEAARISNAKYILKVDAHCAFDKGFDVKLMADMQDDLTMVPIMRNLHAFDWVCNSCGHRMYQGPTPASCPGTPGVGEALCGGPMSREIIWQAKPYEGQPKYAGPSPQSRSYCFDSEPHFQYFGQWNKRPEGRGDLTETMSLQGSCFMMTRDKYFELGACDEALGSWGSQGIEVACKTWLSGGRVVCNHKTWYAHLFRTQGGDFGFPYPLGGHQVERAKKGVRELFFEGKWDKAVRPLSWLLERFCPVPGWTDEDYEKIKTVGERFYMVVGDRDRSKDRCSPDSEDRGLRYLDMPGRETMEMGTGSPQELVGRRRLGTESGPSHNLLHGIVYYTDNRLDPAIMTAAQHQLDHCRNGHQLVSVSLKPLDPSMNSGRSFGENITLDLERSILTMFKQILAGLEASTAEVVFLAEHDVLYAPEYWDFVPPDPAKIYYNVNVWQVSASTGHAVYYTAKRTSQLCAYRDVLLEHYRKRVERVEREGFTRKIGFEPASHGRSERIDDLRSDAWKAKYPNLDIKHGKNLTPARWATSEFRDQRNCRDWIETDGAIPYWGQVAGRFEEFLEVL